MLKRNYLLLDYGASSIKTAIFNADNDTICLINKHQFPTNISAVPYHFEVSLADIKKQFLGILGKYFELVKGSLHGVFICSQMHGFALLDKNNSPLTNYISWKDERSLELIDQKNTFDLIATELGDDYKKITGMKARPGLPFFGALHLARKNKLGYQQKIITLPEWLAFSCNESKPLVHNTMAAGLGIYDIKKNCVSDDLLYVAKKHADVNWNFASTVSNIEISGYWLPKKNCKVPIYVGVGDHQCAILGAQNKPKTTISINIGTGSQVSIIDGGAVSEDIELRPYFGDHALSTITHIPAGRALDQYLALITDIGKHFLNKKINPWETLSTITNNDVLNASLEFDLALFNSAYNFKNSGNILNIRENTLNTNNYCASLIKSLILQYTQISSLFLVKNKVNYCILSGGVARNLPIIAETLSNLIGIKCIQAKKTDETLLGLGVLARESCYNKPARKP